MPEEKKKNPFVIIGILIALIAAGAAIYFTAGKGERAADEGWQTYIEEDYGISLRYPPDWQALDELSPESCCLFVVDYIYSTTTATSSDPAEPPKESVTIMERAKLQIGYYDKATFDPFQTASTTRVVIDGREFYTGMNGPIPFYLLPRTDTEGVGIAVFTYAETDEEAYSIIEDIIETVELLPRQ